MTGEEYLKFYSSTLSSFTNHFHLNIHDYEEEATQLSEALSFNPRPHKEVILNHLYNAFLWAQEDKARDPKASDKEIAQVKRRIDQLNQLRNDATEKINLHFVEIFAENLRNSTAPLFTETPGQVLDRMSIGALKEFFYCRAIEEKQGEDQTLCKRRLEIAQRQNRDLTEAFDHMIHCLENSTMRFRHYRQLKTYNDSRLNPYLK